MVILVAQGFAGAQVDATGIMLCLYENRMFHDRFDALWNLYILCDALAFRLALLLSSSSPSSSHSPTSGNITPQLTLPILYNYINEPVLCTYLTHSHHST